MRNWLLTFAACSAVCVMLMPDPASARPGWRGGPGIGPHTMAWRGGGWRGGGWGWRGGGWGVRRVGWGPGWGVRRVGWGPGWGPGWGVRTVGWGPGWGSGWGPGWGVRSVGWGWGGRWAWGPAVGYGYASYAPFATYGAVYPPVYYPGAYSYPSYYLY
jgi:hypothetical protein